jgi:hypothetical protein
VRPHLTTVPTEQKCGKDGAERGSRIEDREHAKLADLPLKGFEGLLSLHGAPQEKGEDDGLA